MAAAAPRPRRDIERGLGQTQRIRREERRAFAVEERTGQWEGGAQIQSVGERGARMRERGAMRCEREHGFPAKGEDG
eukprot:440858-Rhodomonas_salina.2